MTPQVLARAQDVCALPLVRRLAAMLDRDPETFEQGDALPRGWYPILFNIPTLQSNLREDGAGQLGLPLPDLGLPRLMIAGRRAQFMHDIPIGATVFRQSRSGEAVVKAGRSGRFALLSVEHLVFLENPDNPALIETQQYVLKPAAVPSAEQPQPTETLSTAQPPGEADISRTLLPDERLLFRYSALTDNPHRIHYDRTYARDAEGYPELIVNGTIPLMFLLEMLREHSASTLRVIETRNLSPMLCGQALRLCIREKEVGWRLWAEAPGGRVAFEALAA